MTTRILTFLACLTMFGCFDKSTSPQPNDKFIGTGIVEVMYRDMSRAHFKVCLEDRTLFYNELVGEQRPPSMWTLQNGDKIMIVQRGLRFYWSTGGNLIPFN